MVSTGPSLVWLIYTVVMVSHDVGDGGDDLDLGAHVSVAGVAAGCAGALVGNALVSEWRA